MLPLRKFSAKKPDHKKKTHKQDDYIPIETSEFHRPASRRSLDEAYNPKHYQTYKAKKKHADNLKKLNDLKTTWHAVLKTDPNGKEEASSWKKYTQYKNELMDQGYEIGYDSSAQTHHKFIKTPEPKTAEPSSYVGADVHALKLVKLNKLGKAWNDAAESGNAYDEEKAWDNYQAYNKQLKQDGYKFDGGAGNVYAFKEVPGGQTQNTATVKGALAAGGIKIHKTGVDTPDSKPTSGTHEDKIAKLENLNKLRQKMIDSGHSTESIDEYDKEKAKLKADGILPPIVPGKDWVTAYKMHVGLEKKPEGYTPPAEKPKPAEKWDSDDDDHHELHHRLVAAHQTKGSNDAIRSYTGSGSRKLNGQMREDASHSGHQDSYHQGKVKKLRKQLDGYAAPETFHVYTGVPNSPLDLSKAHYGTPNADKKSIKVHTRAFTSTSIKKSTAKGFAHTHASEGGGYEKHVLKIRIPKDSKHGKYVAHESNHFSEQEFILNHSKNMLVHPVPKIVHQGSTKIHYWDTEIVPDSGPDTTSHVDYGYGKPTSAKSTSKAAKPHPVAKGPKLNILPTHPITPQSHFSKSDKSKLVAVLMSVHHDKSAHALATMIAKTGQMSKANAMYYIMKLKKAK